MSIHHAVLKQATKLKIDLQVTDDGIVATDQTTNGSFTANTASDAVALVLEARKAAGLGEEPKVNAKRAPKPKKAKRKAKSEGDEDEEDGDDEGKSVVAPKYKKLYRPHKDTCGDDFVNAMAEYLKPDGEEIDLGRFVKLAKDNGVDPHRWDKKNIGMRRMNLGNVLRGMINKGQDVQIGSKTIKGKPQPEKAKKPIPKKKDKAA